MPYLLDADVFIQAKNLHYGFDFCPAFWEWLIEANARDRVFSVEKVQEELEAGRDELAVWAAARDPGFFLSPTVEVVQALSTVSDAVTPDLYEPAAIATFLAAADYYLVAHALAGGHDVVTHERPRNSRKRIAIPDVCKMLAVNCVTPFDMLRREGARFVAHRAP